MEIWYLVFGVVIISLLIEIPISKRRANKENYISKLENEVNILRNQQYQNQKLIEELQRNRNLYHRTQLLTKNEYHFYERLKQRINQNELQILAKIRLADLVGVNNTNNQAEWHTAFNKIKSKHIDFAIAKDMKIIIIIELDDNSHNRPDRIERDSFVNEILQSNGYKLVRTYGDMLPIEQALMEIGYNLETQKLMN